MSAEAFLQQVRVSHRQLGIEEGYAMRCGLPLYPEPAELTSAGVDVFGRERELTPGAARAWQQMQQAAATEGVLLQLVSAFRSVAYQHELIAAKLAKGQTLQQILAVNAAPGYSEHHSGRAIDLTTPGVPVLEVEFEASPAFAWLQARAGAFGFSLSFPENNAWGITYEPWHWCWHENRSALA
jgi:D-alanyl-D-alanine carboxypeptidase